MREKENYNLVAHMCMLFKTHCHVMRPFVSPWWYLIGTLQLVAAESFQSLSEMWGVRLHSRPTESKSAF